MPHYVTSTQQVHKNRRDWHNLKSILPFLWEYRGRALFALACLILSKFANVGIPLIYKQLIDYFEGKTATVLLLPIGLLVSYGILRLSMSLFNELRDVVFARVRYRAMRRLSTRVLTHLHRLSLRFHLQRKTGAISRDLERGTRSVSTILNYMVFNIIPIMVEFSLVAIILLSQYNWLFTLVTFATVILYITFTFLITEWRMDFRHHMNQLDSQANNQALDSLINYETVQYFNNQALELKNFDQTLEKWENWAVRSQSSMSLLNFGQASIIAIGATIVMSLGAKGVIEQQLSIGDFVLINTFMLQLFMPLNFLGIVYRQIKYSLADMDLIFKLLAQKPEIEDAPQAPKLKIKAGLVEFKAVDFYYEKSRPILNQMDFCIPAGKKIAVVGHSGAGKSTLSRLLFRFYDLSAGEILIDGQNIATVTQKSLRQSIGIVPQDTILFHESILYNIQYGNPKASQKEVKKAAQMAHIFDFIESLPDGWETIVGERGLKLSGGEKQRVAIARAILKQPKIMIFDEATSSLDSQTEKKILKTLQQVSKKQTTLVIAHRLSTIVDADQILVMENGHIIEQGTHQQLMQQKTAYYQLWQLQQEQAE